MNKQEAATVKMVFERFIKTGSPTRLVDQLRAEGVTRKSGQLIDKGYLYQLLNNRVYIGAAVHKGESFPGEHKAIVPRQLWDKGAHHAE
jgi:site-specific DNA recombinase